MAKRCIHDLLTEQCVDCAPVSEGLVRFVYTTKGGTVFHRSSHCKALDEGQEYALSLGQETHPRRRVALTKATSEGRGACAYCFWDYHPT